MSLPARWREPAEGAVVVGGRLRVACEIPRNAGLGRLALLVNGDAVATTDLSEGDTGYAVEIPIDGRPARLVLQLRGIGRGGATVVSEERVVWRAGYRPERPGMPVLRAGCVIEPSGGRFVARGRLSIEGGAIGEVALWRAGESLATASPGADGAFEAEIDRPDAVHLWAIAEPGSEPVSAGPAGGFPARLASDRLTLSDIGGWEVAEGRIALALAGPDAERAVVTLDGRPIPPDFARRATAEGVTIVGRTRPGGPMAVAEAFVDGALVAREIVWTLDRSAFRQFRRGLRARRDIDLTLASGEELKSALPLQMADAADGWRFFVRRAGQETPEEFCEAEVGPIDVTATPLDYPPEMRLYRKSFAGRQEATIGEEAWGRLGGPVLLPEEPGRPIAAGRPRRVVLIRTQPFPTDEIYVLAPLAPLVEAGRVEIVTVDTDPEEVDDAVAREPLRDDDLVVVVRYASPRWLDRLAAARERIRIVYLVDDDVLAAIDTPGLGQRYRRRMIDVARWDFAGLLRLCDGLVVTSPHLRERFASPRTHLLEPPGIRREVGLDHHGARGEVRIGYHGGGVHRDDLEMALPAVLRAIEGHPRAVLELFSSAAEIARFAKHPQIRILKPLDWPDYKAWAAKNPCHMTLAPMLDTPYNAGKSIIKFCDAASSGAVGVYSDLAPYRGFVEDGVDGFLVANDPAAWEETLARLLASPERVAQAARACGETAAARRPVAAATAFWSELIFGLDGA